MLTSLSSVTYYGDYNGMLTQLIENDALANKTTDPILYEAKLGNTNNYTAERQVIDMGNATVLRLILTSVGFPASHPMVCR